MPVQMSDRACACLFPTSLLFTCFPSHRRSLRTLTGCPLQQTKILPPLERPHDDAKRPVVRFQFRSSQSSPGSG